MHPLWASTLQGNARGEAVVTGERLAIITATDADAFIEQFLSLGKAGYHLLLQPEGLSASDQDALTQRDVSALKAQSILIRTGGSSGQLKFCIHNADTLWAAAQAQADFLGIRHNFCVLPLWHVSGLMQLLRSFVKGGRLHVGDLKQSRLPVVEEDTVVSLVPTQLHRLMKREGGVEWLRQFEAILLGGAAAEAALLQRCHDEGIRLAPCYGMTETAAFTTCLQADEFLAGKTGVGRPLPHVRIQIIDTEGKPLEAGQTGRIYIAASSLAKGYWPEAPLADTEGWFATGDQGYLDAEGYLHITGRIDRMITTGGETVNPDAIAQVLKAAGLVQDIHIVGQPDSEWGEVLVAHVEARAPFNSAETLKAAARERLAPAEVPKIWRFYEALPRTAAGKIDFSRLQPAD